MRRALKAAFIGQVLAFATWAGAGMAGDVLAPPSPRMPTGASALAPPTSEPFPNLEWLEPRLNPLTPSTASPVPDVLQALAGPLELSGLRESLWLKADERAHAQMLATRQVRTLVIPAQVQGFGTDRSARSSWTADLAYALAERGELVADPYLVMRALGDGQRTIPLPQSDAFAQQLHATQLIETFIGHDRHNHLTLLVRVYRKASAEQSVRELTPEVFAWSGLEFSDERPPEVVSREMIPQLLQKLRTPPIRRPTGARPPPAKWVSLALPSTPAGLVSKEAAGADVPLQFALLAALSPTGAERAGERLYEKSLLSLDRSALAPEQERFLRGYLYFKLHLRPAAIAALGNSRSSAALALRELMSGNLPGTDTLVAKVPGIERVLLEIELHDLSVRYSVPQPSASYVATSGLAARGADWALLLTRRFGSLDLRSVQPNIALKAMLDAWLPVHGFTAADAIAQQAASRPRDGFDDTELAVAEHASRVRARSGSSWCNAQPSLRPQPWDLLDLLESGAEARLISDVRVKLDYQGSPAEALRELDWLDKAYAGHPVFMGLRAIANARLAANATSGRRDNFVQSAMESGRLASRWAQGQSESLIFALRELAPIDPNALGTATAYSYDVPGRDYWFIESSDFVGTMEARATRLKDMLAYTQSSLVSVTDMLGGGPEQRQEALTALEGRFKGHPEALTLRQAVRMINPVPSSPTLATLRAAIETEPHNWKHYDALGRWLITQGDYKSAGDAYAGYPGFASSAGQDTVLLANHAYNAASIFYWRAQIEPAKRLLQVAARYSNGSEAAVASGMMLRIMSRDFAGALVLAEQRAKAYPDEYSLRDYVDLLYAVGNRGDAAAVFNANALIPDGPGTWEAALFGLRLMGQADSEIPGWIRDRVAHSNAVHAFRYGAQFALAWNVIDRKPAMDLAELVRVLAHDPIGTGERGGGLYPSLDSPGRFSLVRPSAFRGDQRRPNRQNEPLDSDVTLFARAYVALRDGKFAEAVHLFDDLAARYVIEAPIINGSATYALPYFAYASSKSADPLGLETFLERIPESQFGFDHYLAKAFFAASRGDREETLASVKRAYDRMPYVEGRPIPVDYQYIEACEWMYAQIPDPRLRSLMLDFARHYQVVNPFRAWPYAVEAQYSGDRGARAKALGLAVYFDPNSVRLQQFSPEELNRARAWAKNARPFDPVKATPKSSRLSTAVVMNRAAENAGP